MTQLYCPDCGNKATLTPENWHCSSCGGAWEIVTTVPFDASLINQGETSVWRYLRLYDLDFAAPKIVMGAGWTPLLPLTLEREIWVKPEYFSPTGSFKDRGTELMINILTHQGVTHIAEDSSGNAGASVAAYAARAGMQAEIFVPAHASPSKQAQISIYGAHVNPIAGPRVNAKLAAIDAVRKGIVYASHAFHPGFLLGQTSVAFEVWEQLGRRAPDWYVVPVGQGVHLLGAWLGFQRLLAAGLIDRIPHIVGVQAALLAPVFHAYELNLEMVPGVEPQAPSIAEGLAIAKPVRGRRVLEAIRQSGGTCVSVTEEDISAARMQMAQHGFYIEPTSATAVAALRQVYPLVKTGETIVVPLTGSGLKGTPALK